MRKNLNCSMGKNLKMNDDVYALRTEVMGYIYDAKNLLRANGINLPRVTVRITDNDGDTTRAIGMARLNDDIIWISKDALTKHKSSLREVVYHEIVHAVTGFDHDDKCKLMSPCCNIKPLTKELADELFLKYFKKH